MHGLIHIILKDLVVSKFGEEKWAAIGAKLGLAESGDGPILEEKQYPDETTVAGIATTAEVLGVSFEDGECASQAYRGRRQESGFEDDTLSRTS
mmetsp:Transcript_89539/g.255752  ORF Transcript_89539/g.255752 Transcript_89539/m.255752 type:complete len:94 (+) Transcript_89539:179-460(+)